VQQTRSLKVDIVANQPNHQKVRASRKINSLALPVDKPSSSLLLSALKCRIKIRCTENEDVH